MIFPSPCPAFHSLAVPLVRLHPCYYISPVLSSNCCPIPFPLGHKTLSNVLPSEPFPSLRNASTQHTPYMCNHHPKQKLPKHHAFSRKTPRTQTHRRKEVCKEEAQRGEDPATVNRVRFSSRSYTQKTRKTKRSAHQPSNPFSFLVRTPVPQR